MNSYDRNGHLNRFDEFAPVKRSIDDIVEEAIAYKNGKPYPEEPEPELIKSFATADLVRYRLNSRRLADAYKAMGDPHTDPYDDTSASWRMARFGIVDRERKEPIAILRVLNNPNRERGFEIALPSFSKTRKLEPEEFLEILQELDVPPSRRNGEDHDFVRHYDIWHEDGEWVLKEPRHLVVYNFHSTCFSVHPAITDTVDVYVPLDPDKPLDGNGDENAAYWTKEHYRNLAHAKFWDMGVHTRGRPGFSSWVGYGDPKVVKVTGASLYQECEPVAAAQAKPGIERKP
ncbi:hypothetical protein OIU34_23100 [Pararhizobium sp. BT-229]|uniref:hypothetical protein n=1 Tax=Pararhizobium sp. BT-229 TaxID=2986923 RepID=UPI0021F6C4AB|nr:hypothetical protein [Pararhizobium sp. BT-229]MCV9964783.1 hypothetical protein [Pararhizobium sp. BT-229]